MAPVKSYWCRVKFKGYEEDIYSNELPELAGRPMNVWLIGIPVHVKGYSGQIKAFAETEEELIEEFGSLIRGAPMVMELPPAHAKRQPKKNIVFSGFVSPQSEKRSRLAAKEKQTLKSSQLQNKKQGKEIHASQIDALNELMESRVKSSVQRNSNSQTVDAEDEGSSLNLTGERLARFLEYEKSQNAEVAANSQVSAEQIINEKNDLPAEDPPVANKRKKTVEKDSDVDSEEESDEDRESTIGEPVADVPLDKSDLNGQDSTDDETDLMQPSSLASDKSKEKLPQRILEGLEQRFAVNHEFQLKYTELPEIERKNYWIYKEGEMEIWVPLKLKKSIVKKCGTPGELISKLLILLFRQSALELCTMSGGDRGLRDKNIRNRPRLNLIAINAILKMVRSVATDVQRAERKYHRVKKQTKGKPSKNLCKSEGVFTVRKYVEDWTSDMITGDKLRRILTKRLDGIKRSIRNRKLKETSA